MLFKPGPVLSIKFSQFIVPVDGKQFFAFIIRHIDLESPFIKVIDFVFIGPEELGRAQYRYFDSAIEVLRAIAVQITAQTLSFHSTEDAAQRPARNLGIKGKFGIL